MKVLSLEESKKITIKFLRHFGCYDKGRVEKYFTPFPTEPKMTFFNWLYKFFTASLPKRMTIYDFFPSNVDVFKKHYGTFLSGSDITLEEEKKYDKLCISIEKTLKGNNISLLYIILNSRRNNKKVISLSPEEISERIGVAWARGSYIISDNLSFLLDLSNEDAVVIYGSQRIISDLKKNYQDYRTDFISKS